MKTQTGMRLDSTLWHNYKAFCENSNIRPCEPVEAFMKACINRQDVHGVLNALQGQSPSQTMAYELDLKTELMKLQSDFDVDNKLGEAKNYLNVQQWISNIIKILPMISGQTLLSETQRLVEKTLKFYGPKLAEEEETYRRREKVHEQDMEDSR